jgi:hypothetical protein
MQWYRHTIRCAGDVHGPIGLGVDAGCGASSKSIRYRSWPDRFRVDARIVASSAASDVGLKFLKFRNV